jgi:hypothetical protein
MVSSGPPPDGAQRFEEAMARARQRLAVIGRAGDELASQKKRPTRSHEDVIDDLLDDLLDDPGTG